MRTIHGGDPVTVVWFRVPKDRAWLRGMTPFRSRNWHSFPENDGIGEQRLGKDCCGVEPLPYYNGRAPAWYDGDDPCGDPRSWREGAVQGRDTTFLTNSKGQPPCCSTRNYDSDVRIGDRALTAEAERDTTASEVRIGDRALTAEAGPDATTSVVRIGDRLASEDIEEAIGSEVRIGVRSPAEETAGPEPIPSVVRIGDRLVSEDLEEAIGSEVRIGVKALSTEGQAAVTSEVRIGVRAPTEEGTGGAVATASVVRIGVTGLSSEGQEATASDVRIGVRGPTEEGETEPTASEVRIGVRAPTEDAMPGATLSSVRIGVRADDPYAAEHGLTGSGTGVLAGALVGAGSGTVVVPLTGTGTGVLAGALVGQGSS